VTPKAAPASARRPKIGALPGPKASALVQRDEAALSTSFTRPYPLAVAKGEGLWMTDVDGNEFLDFTAGIAVTSTGHSHPKVVAAIEEQARRFLHMSGTDFYYEPEIRLAERLAANAPVKPKARVFFANSGAETIEGAIKLARWSTRRPHFLAFTGAFHGRTMGALSATPQREKQDPFAPLVPGFVVVPRDDAAALEDAVGHRTAAVFIEPIQGESGIHPIDPVMLLAAREACDREGALLVYDEIQCGMGRTGTMWGFESGGGPEPDVMTVAKGLGGGLPIGACITSPRCARSATSATSS
jgi:4-aminobutyrate aminotransferase